MGKLHKMLKLLQYGDLVWSKLSSLSLWYTAFSRPPEDWTVLKCSNALSPSCIYVVIIKPYINFAIFLLQIFWMCASVSVPVCVCVCVCTQEKEELVCGETCWQTAIAPARIHDGALNQLHFRASRLTPLVYTVQQSASTCPTFHTYTHCCIMDTRSCRL